MSAAGLFVTGLLIFVAAGLALWARYQLNEDTRKMLRWNELARERAEQEARRRVNDPGQGAFVDAEALGWTKPSDEDIAKDIARTRAGSAERRSPALRAVRRAMSQGTPEKPSDWAWPNRKDDERG